MTQWIHNTFGPQALFVSFLGGAPLFVTSVCMPGPPQFDSPIGDGGSLSQCRGCGAPREQRQDTYGTSSSSAGPLRLTLGPGASLPPDLSEEPKVAHIPASNCTGYVVMFSANRTMILQDRSDNYQVQKIPCPQIELQLGSPPERCLAIHVPRTKP